MEPVKRVTVQFERKYTLIEHTCPVCQMVFEGARLKVYCSPECRAKANWERNGAELNAKRKTKKQGRPDEDRASEEGK